MANLQTRLQDAFVRVGTEFKSIRGLINGNVSSLAALKTTAKGNLVAAINEVYDRGSAAGTGDMLKSTYDTNNDGIVDVAATANAVAWTGVTGKPSSFAPAAHDASLITTGTIDPARLPYVGSQVQITSSGGLGDLTAGQQSQITQGAVVTTTDGYRYIYTGSGSKTSPASYITLADVTPEWTAIQNKPTTISGFGITDGVTTAMTGNTDTDLVAVFEGALA